MKEKIIRDADHEARNRLKTADIDVKEKQIAAKSQLDKDIKAKGPEDLTKSDNDKDKDPGAKDKDGSENKVGKGDATKDEGEGGENKVKDGGPGKDDANKEAQKHTLYRIAQRQVHLS